MSPQLAYMEQLAALTRDSRSSPLEAVLRARLIGDRSEVHGIVSPALTRDEPDASLLIYYVYDALKEEPQAREYLRQSIAQLTGDALAEPAPDMEYVDALGRLTGYTHVRESRTAATTLRHHLLSLLTYTLPKEPEDIMTLYGQDLERAHRILDIFLAVTPPLWEGIEKHARDRFKKIFCQAQRDLERSPDQEHFDLFLLLFRAVFKLEPEFAGEFAFPAVCRAVERAQSLTDRTGVRVRRAWLGMCREFNTLLNYGQIANWRQRLHDGLIRQSIKDELQREGFNTIFRSALEKLGFAEELKDIWPEKPELARERFNDVFVVKDLPIHGTNTGAVPDYPVTPSGIGVETPHSTEIH